MFALTMWVLLLTLDDDAPRYRDRIPSPGEPPLPPTCFSLSSRFDTPRPPCVTDRPVSKPLPHTVGGRGLGRTIRRRLRPSCLTSFAGLVIRPNFPEIYYNKTDPRNYADYVLKLENFLQSKAPSARAPTPPTPSD